MTDLALPARPPHVEERHVRIEMHRHYMLQRVAAYRLAAVQFEAMIYDRPDDDDAVNTLSDTLRACQMQMVQAIEVYRQMRDIQGEG